MDIIYDITRVARESKRIIQQQQEEIERLRIENETYRRILKERGITKCIYDGVWTVNEIQPFSFTL